MASGQQTIRPTSTVEQSPDTCQECGGRIERDQEAAEAACADCGLVHEADAVDLGAEWRSFEDDADGAPSGQRTGGGVTGLRHDKGLTTTVGNGRTDRDANGNTLSGTQRRRAHRLQHQQSRTVRSTKSERNATYGLTEINRLVGALEVSDVIHERAAVLFQNAQDAGLFQGRDIDAFTAAAVYAACRENQRPVFQSDIVEAARCDQGGFSLAYGVLKRELDHQALPFMPSDHVPRIATERDLEPAEARRATEIAQAAEDAPELSGRKPSGIAAAAAYMATRDREHQDQPTLEELGETADVTPVTIRQARYAIEDAFAKREA